MNKPHPVPYLKPGDRIGITCPAGPVVSSIMEPMISQLKNWGFEVEVGCTVGSSFHKYSAPDDQRLSELQQMLDNPEINAILFGRGGYGLVRIIDRIDFSRFVENPKWLLGFSDITCLHSHVFTQFGIPTIHAHMSGGYREESRDPASTQSILDVLTGKRIDYILPPHEMNRKGDAEGILVGGNLALISDLIATPSDIDTRNKILFVEDVGEYKYNIDRMMWQLKRSGKLDHLAALLVGGFSDNLDNETEFGMSEYEIIQEKVKDYNYPVYFDVPVGHQPRNMALKIGVQYRIVDDRLCENF